MSDRISHMPLFVDDYEGATAHLTLEEDGAYNRLLRLCWRQPDCSIPADKAWIIRLMRCDEATYERVVLPILKEFFTRAKSRWFQKRLREEHAYVVAVSSARREAGRKGGKAKSLKLNKTEASKATDLPEHLPEQNDSSALAPTPTPTPIESPLPPKRGRAKSRIDPSAEISADQHAIAIERGLSEVEAKAQFLRFRNWAVAKGQTYADWNAAWRNWITSPHYRPATSPNSPGTPGGGYWTSMGFIREGAL